MSKSPPSETQPADAAAGVSCNGVPDPTAGEFDDFTRLAAEICGTSIALLIFADEGRLRIESSHGLDPHQTSLFESFCRELVNDGEFLAVPDASLDPRLRSHPLVSLGPRLRFCASAPLPTPQGRSPGALCVLDPGARQITPGQIEALRILARRIVNTLEPGHAGKLLRKSLSTGFDARRQLRLLESCISRIDDIVIVTEATPFDSPGPRIIYVNDAFVRQTGYLREEVIGRNPRMLQGPKTQRDALDRIRAAIVEGRAIREELINYRKSGQEFWTEIEISPVADARGDPTHLVAIQRDITGRKLEEQERRKLVLELGRRIRELGALHEIAVLLRDDQIGDRELLSRVARVIPGAMPFPDIASARIRFGETIVSTPGYESDARWQTRVRFTTRCGAGGSVTVACSARGLPEDEESFHEEQKALIQAIADKLRAHFERLRATALLRASEERFRRTFQDAATGIAVTTRDGRYLQTNEAYRRMLGYDEAEFKNLDALSITWPEDQPASRSLLEDLREGARETFFIEKRYRHRDGHPVWVRLSLAAIHSAVDGDVVIGVAEDITARKQAESSLAASEARFQQLAESMPIIVWTATPQGEVDFANHHFYDFSGVDRGLSLAESWMSCLHPVDLGICLASWQDSVTTGEDFNIEYRVREARGGEYRWFSVQARPIRDEQGAITRWFGTGVDIDQTRKLQEAASKLARSLTTTLESITDAFITVERDWKVGYVNSEAERQLEIPRDQLVGGNLRKQAALEPGPRFWNELERAMAENVTVAFEETFPGLGKCFDIRVYPSVEGLAIYLQNVTESRRSREAIAVSEERFRLLSKATDDAIWDLDLATGEIWRNEGFAAFYGPDLPVDAISANEWPERIHPQDHDRVVSGLRSFIDGDGTVWSDEYRVRRQDGSYAHVFDRGSLIRDSRGRAIRMIGGMSDISARKQSENKLREQATLLDKAQDAILVRDLDHRILYWNQSAERLYGWTAAEVAGRSIKDLLYDDPGDFVEATRITLANGEWIGEIQQVTRNGRPITVEGRWSLVRDDEGCPRSILAINTDITERKGLEQQFLRAQRLDSLGTLAGGIAHDLNNVLAPIIMSIDLLKLTITDGDDLDILSSMAISAKRGADMVSQVLSFARGMESHRAEVDVRNLVDDIIRITRDTFPKSILVGDRLDPGLWTLRADSTQLHQVLLNLCVNARDAMPDGGAITITASNVMIDSHYAALNVDATAGPHLKIEVEDEGTGIPPGIIDKLFDPFFTTKEVGKGTGLGLSTSLGIVKSHNGFVRVTSEPGVGTRFTICLPAESAAGEFVAPPPETPLPRGNGETVLVVDDEPTVLQITKRTLETFGYSVLTAADGAEGVAVYAGNRGRVDVVLTDMMMPVMDGRAMIKALRHLDPELPVIAASGVTAADGNVGAGNAAGWHSLPKPYTAERLLTCLRSVLSARS